MAGSRFAGPQDSCRNPEWWVDEGTMCRSESPAPGPNRVNPGASCNVSCRDHIRNTVGALGANNPDDVLLVQKMLNVTGVLKKPLKEDKHYGKGTLQAIRFFQSFLMPDPTGFIKPGDETDQALHRAAFIEPFVGRVLYSGESWYEANEADYPYGRSIDHQYVDSHFKSCLIAFRDAMTNAGIDISHISVVQTWRPFKRCYLMWMSGLIGSRKVKPGDAKPYWLVMQYLIHTKRVDAALLDKRPCDKGDVPIVWDHGDDSHSRAAAKALAAKFGVVYSAAFPSPHCYGQAIDWYIKWSGNPAVHKKNGDPVQLCPPGTSAPTNGVSNAHLHAVGATYDVVKLVGDAPHWHWKDRKTWTPFSVEEYNGKFLSWCKAEASKFSANKMFA
jgi:hypothetical protein